jgi:HEAT repeat protein
MRHRRSPRSSFPRVFPWLWPAIVLLMVSSGVDVAWGCVLGGVAAPRAHLWRGRLETQLQALLSGTRDERLKAAARSADLFERRSIETPDPSDPEPEEIAWALLNAIEMQPDDFVGWSILDSFIGSPNRGVHMLLRDALHASSPNVRARAVRFFTYNDDDEAMPALESLWEGGLPEWARADLIEALARQKSSRYAEDFIRLTADDDPGVALAAVEALDDLDDVRSLPRMLELARTGGPALSPAALSALASWPESDEAFRFVLASSFGEGRTKGLALGVLGVFRRAEGDQRLLEVLDGPDADPDDPLHGLLLRLAAARALEDSDLPGVTESILRLMTTEAEAHEWVVGGGLILLHKRDDPAALPGLAALAPVIRSEDREAYDDLVEYLGRSNPSDTHGTLISTECNLGPPDPDDPDTWHVVAPCGFRSIRCSDGPAFAGSSWLEKRIPDGTLLTVDDRFDRDGKTWGYADWDDGICWVPMDLLGRGAATRANPPDSLNPEIDVPAGALASKTAKRLVGSGVLEVLDQEGDVAGVAFHLELQGPTLVSLLEAIRDDARRAVADDMDDVVEEAAAPRDDETALDDSGAAGGDEVVTESPDEAGGDDVAPENSDEVGGVEAVEDPDDGEEN